MNLQDKQNQIDILKTKLIKINELELKLKSEQTNIQRITNEIYGKDIIIIELQQKNSNLEERVQQNKQTIEKNKLSKRNLD